MDYWKYGACLLGMMWLTLGLGSRMQAQTLVAEQGLPSDSVFARYLQAEGIPLTHNNELQLLKSGSDKFTALFEEIRQARHHIFQ